MTTKTGDKLKRKRGRKSATQTAQEPRAYDFPSLDDILRLTNEQVRASFEDLGVEPSAFRWRDEDDQWNVALWHDHGLTMSEDERMKSAPKDKEGIAKLRAESFAIHNQCLRMGLMSANIEHWVDGLTDDQLLEEVERLSNERLSESSKRYLKIADARQQVVQLVWPVLVAASTLYQPPKNPLES